VRDDLQLYLEALHVWIELQRRGTIAPATLDELAARLERHHPAPVHATVHLLRAERALLAGELSVAVAAQREARPYVQASRWSALRKRYESVAAALRAPFVEVEDWDEPLRPLSREELAQLEARPWQLWVDTLHRRVSKRAARSSDVQSTTFTGAAASVWALLEAVVRTSRRRLSWEQARQALDLPDVEAARALADRVARKLSDIGLDLVRSPSGASLPAERFIFVFPLAQLPSTQRRFLAQLATHPGARSAELAGDGVARRTTLRHLAQLRALGYVRMVGGGREARYYLV
jgi:hypothetical protein